MAIATQLDPITYEVIRHRLWSINEEGSTTIVHASGSPVVHGTDYNFGLYTADGDMAVSGVFYMLPMYVMELLCKRVIEEFGDDIHPGDVWITNDPYVAGVHQSDIEFVAPFFHDGELVAWSGCMAHVMDVGGMNPGSWCPEAIDVYQEGTRIPIERIVDEGKVNRGLWNTILANSRLPSMVANDFSAFLSSHRVAHARLEEACRQYGVDALRQTMRRSIELTEEQMRDWLRELPDGEFQHVGFVDHDGHANNLYKVMCTMRKTGDGVVFDYEGTDDAIVGMGNASASGTYGGVATAVMGIFGSKLDWNAGLMRPFDVKTPHNSCISAVEPMPISAGSISASWIAECAAVATISKLLAFSDSEYYRSFACGPPDACWLLSQMGGRNQYGEPFATMLMDSLGWGGPAFRGRDGVNSGGALVLPGGGFNDVELHENHQPIVYLWRREVKTSGGAGRHRGGNGIEWALAIHDSDDVIATCGTQGVVVPTCVGMFGAYPGSTCSYEIVTGSDWQEQLAGGRPIEDMQQLGGDYRLAEAKQTVPMKMGDVINHITSNGGGFGDPLERDPELVVHDVVANEITPEAATTLYGVVIAGDAVDAEATERRREELRRRRLADLQNVHGPYEAREDLEVVQRWEDVINIVRDGGAFLVQAAQSGVILGPLGENWRDVAPYRVPAPEELMADSLLLRIDDRLEFRQYVDPTTGRSLWLDVQRKGDEPISDFRLAGVNL
jgi:N-methylhydantoinase B